MWLHEIEEHGLTDYKFFCFDGVVKALYVATDRQNQREETKFDFFDRNFVHLNIMNEHPNSTLPIRKPIQFDKMVELAEKIASNMNHLRVDFYETKESIYVGELTLFHMSGMTPFEPETWDEEFGSWIKLPNYN